MEHGIAIYNILRHLTPSCVILRYFTSSCHANSRHFTQLIHDLQVFYDYFMTSWAIPWLFHAYSMGSAHGLSPWAKPMGSVVNCC